MQALWNTAIGITGIGAIGALVMWSIYKDWLRLNIFQTMTKKQQFILFILTLTFTFLFAIACLIAYVIVHEPPDKDERPEITWKTNPPDYRHAKKIPVGAEFTIQLEGLPANADLITWSYPSHGSLNSQTGNNNLYTATSPGRDEFSATIRSSEFSFTQNFSFNIEAISIEPVKSVE